MNAAADHMVLDALLQHPSLWRGRGAAQPAGVPSGFAALDALLPGGGWPRRGLIEILAEGSGCGELALCMPLVRQLTQGPEARWCAFVSPPFEPFAPAWQARGAQLDRLLVIRAPEVPWALEQVLLSGACSLGFAWMGAVHLTVLRRLALAAERGAALGVLIRPLAMVEEPTAAVLRLSLKASATGLTLRLLKGRGVSPVAVELPLP